MNKTLNDFRLFLCTFSGEDDYIIRRCPTVIQISFASIGLFVILIFSGCIFSAATFSYSVFENSIFLSVPFGILWALIIIVIYLLLLYTISPPILPLVKKHVKVGESLKSNEFLTLSMVLRIVFIGLLAMIIAQPINVYMHSELAKPALSLFQEEQKARMIIVSDSILIEKEISLQKDYVSGIGLKPNKILVSKIEEDKKFLYKACGLLDSIKKIDKMFFVSDNIIQKRNHFINVLSKLVNEEVVSDHDFVNNIAAFSSPDGEHNLLELQAIMKDKIENYEQLDSLLAKSNFYVQTIRILLNGFFKPWLTTILICFIFLLPIYLKFIIRNKSGFYNRKENIERRIIIDSYQEFKNKHAVILQNRLSYCNDKHKTYLTDLLVKYQDINSEKHLIILDGIDSEYRDEIVSRYEHWEDCPFKTKKKNKEQSSNTESDLLKLLYNDPN